MTAGGPGLGTARVLGRRGQSARGGARLGKSGSGLQRPLSQGWWGAAPSATGAQALHRGWWRVETSTHESPVTPGLCVTLPLTRSLTPISPSCRSPVRALAALGQAPVVFKVCFLTEETLSAWKRFWGGSPACRGSAAGGHVMGKAGKGPRALPTCPSQLQAAPLHLCVASQEGGLTSPEPCAGVRWRARLSQRRQGQPGLRWALSPAVPSSVAMRNSPQALLGP